MKGKMKGKMYLVLLTLIAATLWLAGCSASKDNGEDVYKRQPLLIEQFPCCVYNLAPGVAGIFFCHFSDSPCTFPDDLLFGLPHDVLHGLSLTMYNLA